MVLNVILNEAKSPYHVIGAVMETTKSARSFISNITRGSEVFQKYMSNAHHCNINLIAFSHTFPSFECAPVIANEVKYIGNRIRANIRNTVKFNSERALLKMKKILSSMSRRLMFQKLVSHEPSLKKLKNFITMHRPTPRDGRRQKRVTSLRLAELKDLFMAIPSKSMRPLLPLYDVFQDLASAAKNAGVDVSTSFGKSLSLLLPLSLSFHPSLLPPPPPLNIP